ncbi:hypothetical protein [uncultured Eubacterium sp.]|uniref:hypothetical protein n=1 Tax=uncultured Eubacterium sp. TaxID=165185 RepID=UPI0026724631|nr:hypothetical protein [uncultured Eubacterium sp.]
MKEQEAIELLKKAAPIIPMSQTKYNQFIDAVNMGIDVLEKQIAKRPDYEGDGYADGEMVYDTWICPCCEKKIRS